MAREPKITVILPTAVAAYAYIYEADTKAPEGAKFKPDGKFKVTAVYSDVTLLEPARQAMIRAMKAKWPAVDPSMFTLPIHEIGSDNRKEELRGKTIVKAASKFGPNPVDSRGTPLPPVLDEEGNAIPGAVRVKSGDLIRVKTSLYLYEKSEEETLVENGVRTKVQTTTYGCSLQMDGVQLIEKRAGGDDGWGDPDSEGGYVAPQATAPKAGQKLITLADVDPDAGDGDF